jgi:hypothetical protein
MNFTKEWLLLQKQATTTEAIVLTSIFVAFTAFAIICVCAVRFCAR